MTDPARSSGVASYGLYGSSLVALAVDAAGRLLLAPSGSQATADNQAAEVDRLKALARIAVVDAATYTRPADHLTAYSIGDAVADSGTAASVTAIKFYISDTIDAPIGLHRIRISTDDTGPGVAGAFFEVYLYRDDPTANSGVVGGDNAAFSTKKGTYIGKMTGQFIPFSDGSVAVCTPSEGVDMWVRPASGRRSVYALLRTQTAFTASKDSSAFSLTLEAFQGRAA
jgi:hypothetical protein